jgi:hypothetical protein
MQSAVSNYSAPGNREEQFYDQSDWLRDARKVERQGDVSECLTLSHRGARGRWAKPALRADNAVFGQVGKPSETQT